MFGPITQDWKPITIKRPLTREEIKQNKKNNSTTVRRETNNKVINSSINGKKANNYDPEQIKPPQTSNMEFSKALQQARMKKGLTQVELNNQCNFPTNTIRNLENKKGILIGNQIEKLNNVLNTKLPRQKK